MPHIKASNIDIFIIKDISHNNACYLINDLASNHISVILKFDRVNLVKKENTCMPNNQLVSRAHDMLTKMYSCGRANES